MEIITNYCHSISMQYVSQKTIEGKGMGRFSEKHKSIHRIGLLNYESIDAISRWILQTFCGRSSRVVDITNKYLGLLKQHYNSDASNSL